MYVLAFQPCQKHIFKTTPSFSLCNRDGGRYNIPAVWDNITKKRVKVNRPRGGVEVGIVTISMHSVPNDFSGSKD